MPVAPQFAFGEHLPPAPVDAFEEERSGASLEGAVEVADLVGVRAHALEGAAVDDDRPARGGDVDVEEGSDAAHLAIEVGLEVVVVDEQDVWFAMQVPPAGEVAQRRSVRDPAVKEPVDVATELHYRVDALRYSFGVEALDEIVAQMLQVIDEGNEC